MFWLDLADICEIYLITQSLDCNVFWADPIMPSMVDILVRWSYNIATITYWGYLCLESKGNFNLRWKIHVFPLFLVLWKLVLFYSQLFWNIVSRLKRQFVWCWSSWLWTLPGELLNFGSLFRCYESWEILLWSCIMNPRWNCPRVFNTVGWCWREHLVIWYYWPINQTHHDLWIGSAKIKKLLPIFTFLFMNLGAWQLAAGFLLLVIK